MRISLSFSAPFLALFLALSSPAWAASSGLHSGCTTAREFITAFEFLRQNKEFRISDAEAKRIATRVASGCTGAAERFIRVTRALSTSGLAAADAIQEGILLSSRTDREAATFVAVFQRAFLKEYLDLDIASSVRMARSLSTEFEGDVLAVRDDFEKLLDFCLGNRKLDLPRPQCGSFAAEIAKEGQAWSGGISRSFLTVFDFLSTHSDGPGLVVADALKVSRQLLQGGPASPESFIQAYRYASSKKGLSLARDEAIQLSRQLANLNDAPPQKSGRNLASEPK